MAVAAWVIASLSRFALSKTLQKMHLDKKISHDVKTSANVSDTIANIAYWFIILFFLPGILGALGQQELLSPIMGIRDQILNFIPNIIAAGVVFIIGWFIAKVLKKITLGVLESIHLDKNLEKTGLKGFSFTQLAGTVVYAIVIIPVAIEALDQLHIDSISGPATVMLSTVLSYIPALFSAIIIVAVAYFIGKFIAKLTSDLLA